MTAVVEPVENQLNAITDVAEPLNASASPKKTPPEPKRKAESKRKISTPTISSSVSLNTDVAQRVFRDTFQVASRSLFTIDVVTRALAKKNTAFDYSEVLNAVMKIIDDIKAKLSKDTAQIEQMLASEKITGKTRYDHSVEQAYSISTPHANRFAVIISDLDNYLVLIDTAWLSGLIPSNAVADLKYGWRRSVLRATRQLTHIARDSMKKVNRSGEELAAEVREELGDDVETDKAILNDSLASEDDQQPAEVA
ncbi:hypothetical protein BLL42_27200 (plasmid) [Pseudomonas frederiksbergensis]|uniref:DUF1845 domain-containing protein n=1 Tax=Pseudomonas frederiksbergensis TaxID=104087 RepID=A0A1J0EUF6_9PSED|nr:hypothetical protein [Pseudomonas frederiksbergensis]APC19428.1 hypothetical protein BLL42_27200 [Pseudomonas frederiksbergensis]